jgi:hypothetical protein
VCKGSKFVVNEQIIILFFGELEEKKYFCRRYEDAKNLLYAEQRQEQPYHILPQELPEAVDTSFFLPHAAKKYT